MPACGDLLEGLGRVSKREACLIAPFVKVGALRRVLDSVPAELSLRLITRWRPEEIASGVSDLEVFELLRDRPHSELRLCHELHAKVYRFDDRVAAGSANLTDAGLGWSAAPNLEFLAEVPVAGHAAELEREAMLRSSVATVEVYNAMLEVVRLLRETQVVKPKPEVPDPPAVRFEDWLPRTRYPEMLERAYRGEWRKLTEATQEAAAYDLAALQVPDNLTSEQFRGYVGAMLLAHPVVSGLLSFLAKPRRFGEVRRYLQSRLSTPKESGKVGELWQVLSRWLVFLRMAMSAELPGRWSEIAAILPFRPAHNRSRAASHNSADSEAAPAQGKEDSHVQN